MPPEPLARRGLFWVSAAFAAGVLLHATQVPLWTVMAATLAGIWALAARLGRVRLPGKVLRRVLTLALTAAVLAMFHTLNGIAAGTALLIVMGALKLLEARHRRDGYMMVTVALALLLAACLRDQSLPLAPLYALHAWLCVSALAVVAHPRSSLGERAIVLLAARALLLALPFAVLMFVFFPRLAGSLWALPRSSTASTGLSEQMSPGSISDLVRSDEPAFRVWFSGEPPPTAQRYFRGPVLHDFDGSTWSRAPFLTLIPSPWQPLGRGYHYRVALEPHAHRWLFVLDTVDGAAGPATRVTPDAMLLATRPVTEPLSYEASSHPLTRSAPELPLSTRNRDTQLSTGSNPRAARLARELRAASASEGAYVRAVLERLRTGGFTYTLTPPLLGENAVDDFLFDTRAGFCGHYASAFALLMRAAGIPARVVTGYLGGEWNRIGGYLLLRQSDAHAWDEVWLEGRGWVRIDPTLMVAPERAQRDSLELLPDARTPAQLLRALPWLAVLRQAWDASNAWWSGRVVGFNLDAQMSTLRRLGFSTPQWQQLVTLLSVAFIAWLAVLAVQMSRVPRPVRADRLGRAYARLCRRIAGAGVVRAPSAGPLEYAQLIAASRPQLAARVRPLIERYIELRFVRAADAASVAAFERDVARLRL